MRILLAGQTYFREDNGQAVFTCRLAKGLADAQHKVIVIAPSGCGKAGQKMVEHVHLQQVPTIRMPFNTNITFVSQALVSNLLESFQPDIIHLQDHYFISRAVHIAAKKFSIPMVGTNHFLPDNIIDNLCLPTFTKHIATKLLWAHMLNYYNMLQKVTTPTQTGVEILYKQKIRPPVEAISCGIDISRFYPPTKAERNVGRQYFTFDNKATIFLYVGRIDHEKGLDTVLEAFAVLDNEHCILYLAGKGSYSSALKKRRDQLGLQKRVVLPGFIPEEDLPRLLHSVDCFVMAGHAELQSIATLEAMASGLPVIAARARALPELVEDNVNGFLFPAHDSEALARCFQLFLDQRSEWRKWRAESRHRACKHDHYRTVKKYVEWYRSVLLVPLKKGRISRI